VFKLISLNPVKVLANVSIMPAILMRVVSKLRSNVMMEMPVPLIGVRMPKVVNMLLLTVLITTNVQPKNV